MEAKFWNERWENNQIGFHQDVTNTLLIKHWPKLSSDNANFAEVFVPLCGKSRDMDWLSAEGGKHRIIGVELSRLAIEQFFTERIGTPPPPKRQGNHDVYTSGRWELWCGDFFEFPAERLNNSKLAYDRASLIALPSEMRQRYAQKLCNVLPADAQTLLLTIDYDPIEMEGPPFSVPDDEVHALFGSRRNVEHLESRDGLSGSKNLQDRGLTKLTASAFIIGNERP